MNQQTVAVVLSGCGVYDGSEITETVALFIALSQANFSYTIFAPNRQADAVNHLTHQVTLPSRNMLTEASRIARGNIYSIDQLDLSIFSALAFPGGMGVIRHLSNFEKAGKNATLYPDIGNLMQGAIFTKKPIMALCAAPLLQALTAKFVGLKNAEVTLGAAHHNADMVDAIVSWNQCHIEKPVDQAHVDFTHRFVSAPAYMYSQATSADIFASCVAAVSGLQLLL